MKTPDGLFTDVIHQARGVRQGGCSSPTFFVLILAHLLEDLVFEWREETRGFRPDDFMFHVLCSGDDLVVVGASVPMVMGTAAADV